MSDKFLHKDLETYLTTKTNLTCYYHNTGMYRNSKNIMSELYKINCLKKIGELYLTYDECCDYTDIAKDLSNNCAFDNKLKNYQEALNEGMQSLALNQLTKINNKFFGSSSTNKNSESLNKVETLSYYNIGVQQEFLNRMKDSKISFKNATEITNLNSDKMNKSLKEKISTIKVNNIRKKARNRSMSCSSSHFHVEEEENITSDIK